MSNSAELDLILSGERDEPMTGEEFLSAMWERRQNYWWSKPAEERTHYVGFSTDIEQVKERLKIQCHAELFAAYVAGNMLEICPWQDLRGDLAKQAYDEFLHFKLIRGRLRHLGGEYEEGYRPPVREWRELISNVTLTENRYYNDPVTSMIAMSASLQFAIEGWDELFIHPHFMKAIETKDPELYEIFDEQIAADEVVHHENGLRAMLKCGDNLDWQRTAIRHFDSAADGLHQAGLGFRNYFAAQEGIPAFSGEGDDIAESIQEVSFEKFFSERGLPL
ncbi:ferritin-like domain-containing protein [Amycolatopsis jejuensis]|uniref:ferritin-like domain-containing protein n=1 Tax=Amycolatopsis jejuensis TaxID=330084 RepID=UPI000525CDF9|nr:ferritin-like domain-containing protein [Amycolatopsis jejuensis]